MDFKEHLKKYLNDNEIDSLIASFSEKENKGIVLNEEKMSKEEFIKLFPNVKPHPFVPNAFLYDKEEYDLGKSVYHDLGAFYIQDPSASLVPYFLDPKEDEEILDMCAAPGGKTIEASLLMNNKGIIYANDISSSRANILLSNIERLGRGNVVVSSLDLSKIKGLENSFDGIILDAPCSGSGMFRRSEAMKEDWTFEKVIKNSLIQKELILLAYSFLKEGGRMIYSTCSYSYEEDEEVIDYLLKNSDATLVPLPKDESFYSNKEGTIHLFPSKFKGEGHFIALIKKPGKAFKNKEIKEFKTTRTSLGKGKSKIIYNFSLPMEPNKILIEKSIRPGLLIASTIGDKTLISHHYSHYLGSEGSYPLSDEEFKKYIHGETLTIEDNKKYSLVSYKGINVGGVSQINNTLKNLYPKGLRR